MYDLDLKLVRVFNSKELLKNHFLFLFHFLKLLKLAFPSLSQVISAIYISDSHYWKEIFVAIIFNLKAD